MSTIDHWQFVETLAARISLTLFHSLWQGAMVGVIVMLLLALLRNRSSRARYAVSGAGMLALCILPVITWIVLRLDPAETATFSTFEPAPAIATPDVTADDENASRSAQPLSPAISVGAIVTTLSEFESPGIPIGSGMPPRPGRTSSDLKESPGSARLAAVDRTSPLDEARQWLSNWSPWIAGFWSLGVAILGTRVCGAWFAASRLRRLGVFQAPQEWQQRLDQLATRMGICSAVALLESKMIDAPVVIGWLKPVVLMPIGMLTGMTVDQVNAIIAHELAHIRRHDYLVNLLQTIAETMLFYHPVVWWLSRRLRFEREQCCDDLAVEICGDRIGYAKALCMIEEQRATTQMALSAGERPLARRIFRLLGDRPADVSRAHLVGCIGVIALLLAGTLIWQQDSSGQEEAEDTADTASLYFDHHATGRENQIWRIDFVNGEEVKREMVMEVGGSSTSRLVNQRYVVSNYGMIVDLAERRILRHGEGSLRAITEEAVIIEKPHALGELVAFHLSTQTERPFLNLNEIKDPIRFVQESEENPQDPYGIVFSPSGKWSLALRQSGVSRALIHSEDKKSVPLPIQCSFETLIYSSNAYAPSPALWLDDERVLFAQTNSKLITANTNGEIEEIVNIPDLDPGEPADQSKVSLSYQLFRDPIGNVVYDAGHLGRFKIDVERKQWAPYPRFEAGHEFSKETWRNTVLRPEFQSYGTIVRYRDEVISQFSSTDAYFDDPNLSMVATDGYLAYVDEYDFLKCWNIHTREGCDLKGSTFKMNGGRLLGWVKTPIEKVTREEAMKGPPRPFETIAKNLDASLFVEISVLDEIRRYDLKDGIQVRDELVCKTTGYGNLGIGIIVNNQYFVSEGGHLINLETGAMITDGPRGRRVGSVGDEVFFVRKHVPSAMTHLYAFNVESRVERLVYEADNDLDYGTLSPDARYFANVADPGEAITIVRLRDGVRRKVLLDGRVQLSKVRGASGIGRRVVWLDETHVLTNATNSRLVRVSTDGDVETIVEISELNVKAEPDESRLAERHELYLDRAGNAVFTAERLGAFAIDLDAKTYIAHERLSKLDAGFGFSIGMDSRGRPEVRYQGRYIGDKLYWPVCFRTLSETAVIDGYFASYGEGEYWSSDLRQWTSIPNGISARVLGWVDHRTIASEPAQPPALESQPSDLVVHEWGVQVMGSSRAKGPPSGNNPKLLGPPQELLDELPAFVERPEAVYTDILNRGWRKPVVHVYGRAGQELKIKVEAPTGVPFAYFPSKPELSFTAGSEVVFPDRMMNATGSRLSGLEWNMTLSDEPPALNEVAPDHWWNYLRDVPGSYLITPSGNERFLFYEATANVSFPLKRKLDDEGLTFEWLESPAADSSMAKEEFSLQPLIILNDLGNYRIGRLAGIPWRGGEKQKIDLDDLYGGYSQEQILQVCRQQWQRAGMTQAESEAIVNTWKPDILGTQGLLCLYTVPRSIYDAMFPITIDPKPDQLVRVGMIFDRVGYEGTQLQSLPRLTQKIERICAELNSPTQSGERNQQARAEFCALRNFSEPLIATKLQSESAYNGAAKLLEQWSDEKSQTTRQPNDASERGPGAEWFQALPYESRPTLLSDSLLESTGDAWFPPFIAADDSSVPDNTQSYWKQHGFMELKIWWDEESQSFHRAPGSLVEMMKFQNALTFAEAERLCAQRWGQWSDSDKLTVDGDDFIAFFDPGENELHLLTKPVPRGSGRTKIVQPIGTKSRSQNSPQGYIVDYQRYSAITSGELRMHRIGSWDEFDLESFTRIDFKSDDDFTPKPERLTHFEAQVPVWGELQISLKAEIPNLNSFVYEVDNSRSYKQEDKVTTIINPEDEKVIERINGGRIWGIDSGWLTRKKLTEMVDARNWVATVLTSIELTLDGKTITAPPEAMANLFAPRLEGSAFISPDARTIVLQMNGSDGAGSYVVRWLFVDGEYRWRTRLDPELNW
ncbi:MAG: M56 family metallopeptidase [Verrucomicrobiales bacterium]